MAVYGNMRWLLYIGPYNIVCGCVWEYEVVARAIQYECVAVYGSMRWLLGPYNIQCGFVWEYEVVAIYRAIHIECGCVWEYEVVAI